MSGKRRKIVCAVIGSLTKVVVVDIVGGFCVSKDEMRIENASVVSQAQERDTKEFRPNNEIKWRG